MTDQEMRIAIAEECGWKRCARNENQLPIWMHPKSGVMYWLSSPHFPDYLNDLNAMHEAEACLSTTQYPIYLKNLGFMLNSLNHAWALCRATARQRAEAFLRTIGKWKD